MSDTKPFPAKRRINALLSKLSLWIFLILAIAGLGMLAVAKTPSGLWLICIALILGFVRFIVLTSRPVPAETETPAESFVQKLPESNLPAAKSPYRTTSAAITPDLLEFLAQAQSNLSQAATDNGWQIDVKKLTKLSTEALESFRNDRLVQCLAARGKALEMLMKEVYVARKQG